MRLNRAVAVAKVEGPLAGSSCSTASSCRTHRLHAVRAHLLEESGDVRGAADAYARAAAMTTSARERDYLTMRAAAAARR